MHHTATAPAPLENPSTAEEGLKGRKWGHLAQCFEDSLNSHLPELKQRMGEQGYQSAER